MTFKERYLNYKLEIDNFKGKKYNYKVFIQLDKTIQILKDHNQVFQEGIIQQMIIGNNNNKNQVKKEKCSKQKCTQLNKKINNNKSRKVNNMVIKQYISINHGKAYLVCLIDFSYLIFNLYLHIQRLRKW